MKKYYAVTSAFYDDGRTCAAITDVVEADQCPESTFKSTTKCDIYVDWFDNIRAAEDFANLKNV